MCDINVVGLRDKAVCVTLRRKMFNPVVTDRYATQVSESALGTNGAGKFKKNLLRKCAELREAQQKFYDVYDFVRKNTLPWMDDGVRVLPNACYLDFASDVGRLRTAALQSVERLIQVWDKAIEDDRSLLGSVFNRMDYPGKEELRRLWDIRIVFSPVPSSEDFRIDMSDADRRALDEQVQEVQTGATEHLLRELFTPIKAMADKLGEDPGERKSPIFRDTLVSNIWDVCHRAKRLNINADSRIDSVIAETEAVLKNVDAQTLRDSVEVRESVQSKMSDIETKLSEWF
jgi:hypothetical protein